MCDSSGECLPCKVTRLEKEVDLLRRFANHRSGCHCYICRTLSLEERMQLAVIIGR